MVLRNYILSFFPIHFPHNQTGQGRQNKMLNNLRLGATWLQDSPGAKEHDESTTHSELQFFDLNTIAAATNNFSSENELGRGGFGSVYKVVSQSQMCRVLIVGHSFIARAEFSLM